VELAACRFMGWSWRELQETPDEVVQDIFLWMRKEAAIGRQQGRVR